MPHRRSSLCALLALAFLGAFVLSGCAGGESAPSPAAASGGAIGELARQEQPEGGEAESSEGESSEAESSQAESSEAESSEAESGGAELKELVDRETTPEQRRELREELEEGAGPQEEGQTGQAQEQEAEQEREAG
jgi:hypothetical protein